MPRLFGSLAARSGEDKSQVSHTCACPGSFKCLHELLVSKLLSEAGNGG